MPTNFFGEFRLHIVIDQICDEDVIPWVAQAVLVYSYSEPIDHRLR
jgi:hypothetical protein